MVPGGQKGRLTKNTLLDSMTPTVTSISKKHPLHPGQRSSPLAYTAHGGDSMLAANEV